MFYCGIVSFLLSQFIVFVLPEGEESIDYKSALILFFSGCIMYFSVNGIQAVYSSVQYTEPMDTDQTAEIIPFLDARPWFPPAGMYERTARFERQIEEISVANIKMKEEVDSLKTVIESCGFMTDSVFLTVIPNSREVPNGGIYRSEIVLAAKLDKTYVKNISVNEEELPINEGVAVFEEVSQIESGNVNVRNLHYSAEIELFNETRTITTFDSYKTVVPFLEVSSQAVNSLYLNCGNQVSINVPALGSDYSPRFEVVGGDFKYGNRPGSMTIVPGSKKVTVSVYNEGVRIGSTSFPVRRIPSPSIRIFSRFGEIDLNAGVGAQISSLELRVFSDPDFGAALPKDALYRVESSEVSLISGGTLKGMVKGKSKVNINHLTRTAKPGDLLKVEVKRVLRRNFKGDVENVLYFNPKFFSIPLK